MEFDPSHLPLTDQRPSFSICIPAYNRSRYLAPLLDSILSQDFADFEIVICEDRSPQREEIAAIVDRYMQDFPNKIRFYENEQNLGYDANVRNLIEKATGRYCFFMGNDDLMSPGAISIAADVVARHPEVGFILRAYAWFDEVPEHLTGEVRYFTEERVFAPGAEAITICFRRSGVISGYIVHRDAAHAAATDKFDGGLYYQMHITARVLSTRSAVYTPNTIVLCRNSEPHEFGNSATERGAFAPGHHSAKARIKMMNGLLAILKDLKQTTGLDLADPILHDYANYFYPYVRSQLDIPLGAYFQLYRAYWSMGFWRFPMFHLYVWLCYAFKQKGFDAIVKFIRGILGRSPHFGTAK